jgi:5,10-methylenetetrahydromethanopterin reductase
MDFGICFSTKIDEVGFVSHAENLGYSHAWITDSQIIASDCFAALALIAQQTRTIKIGTGVAVAGLRIAPSVANSIATIARLAPGRTFFGVGTGNSAWHLMGQKPVTMAEFAEYLRVVRALLAGEMVDYTINNHTAPIQLLLSDWGFRDLSHKIPIYVSAFGPKAQALAGQYGDGVIVSIPRVATLDAAMANVRQGAARANRTIADGYYTCLLRTVAVLEPGEAPNSERIVRECGPAIMAAIHYVYEKLHQSGGEPPPFVRPIWKQFCALMEEAPPHLLHFKLHGSHYTYLPPEEAGMITAEMVQATCMVGQAEEVIEQIRDLEKQGLKHLMFLPPPEHQYRMLEDFSRKVMRKL